LDLKFIEREDPDIARAIAMEAERQRHTRAKELFEQKFITKEALEIQAGTVARQEARVQEMQARVDKAVIWAPFDGVVGLREISPGAYVKAGDDIVRLENLDSIKVDFRIPEVYLAKVGRDQAVAIEVDAFPGETFQGHVYAVQPVVEQETRTLRVTKVTDTKVIYNGGRRVSDLLGNPLRIRKVRISGNQNIPAEFALGKHWSTRWITDRPNGREETDFELRVTARETITVPAGSFDCFRVDFQGLAYGPKGAVAVEGRYWMAPDKVLQMVAQEVLRKASNKGKVLKGLRRELVSYQQG